MGKYLTVRQKYYHEKSQLSKKYLPALYCPRASRSWLLLVFPIVSALLSFFGVLIDDLRASWSLNMALSYSILDILS